MEIKNYRDLKVWQKSIGLVKVVYKITGSFPKDEIYCLTQQIRRSAISVPSNISEGAGKRSSKEYSRFLEISSGSLAELETQMIIAHELGYVSIEVLNKFLGDTSEIGKMVNGLINVLQEKSSGKKIIPINLKTDTVTDTVTNKKE